jgi:hypothetical protein
MFCLVVTFCLGVRISLFILGLLVFTLVEDDLRSTGSKAPGTSSDISRNTIRRRSAVAVSMALYKMSVHIAMLTMALL